MVIEAKGLSFSYPGKKVLLGVNININEGDFVGITGSTGSGKTTLAYCFNGLIPHAVKGKFSGAVHVAGQDTRNMKIAQLARLVGFVFQDPEWQLFSLTVREEVEFGLRNLGMTGIATKTREAIESVGLGGHEETEPYKLSQGQKQLLCIASVLAMQPDIIVLDEPSSSLDYRSTMKIYGILRRLNEQGKTIIVIEHDTDLLAAFTNKAMLMEDGRIVKRGDTRAVMSDKRLLKRLGVKMPRWGKR